MNEDLTKEIQAISEQLAAALKRQLENGNAIGTNPTAPCEYEGFLKFSPSEVAKMPKNFKSKFRASGCTVHYRKRKRGVNSCSYEARYRRDGYNISVSATTLQKVKEKFIEALHAAESADEPIPKVPTNFHEFSMYYFENFRKRKVGKQTYRVDLGRYKNHIQPYMQQMNIKQIIPAQCQDIIDRIVANGYERTAQDVYSILNSIFNSAIAHGIISRNPLAIIQNVEHDREHGKALTREEEQNLLNQYAGTPYQLMFAVALYTGMRPNEYKTAKLDGDFIVAVNSKRKTKKIEYKKIPVTPMLKPYLNGVTEIKFYNVESIREKFHAVLSNHRLYDLRTTFYSRCKECGISLVALMEFVGHSLGKLGNTYTDLSDDFLLSEGKKLKY